MKSRIFITTLILASVFHLFGIPTANKVSAQDGYSAEGNSGAAILGVFDGCIQYGKDFTQDVCADAEGALAKANAAIKADPNDADAYNARGVANAYLGNNKDALTDFNQAIKLD